MLNYPNKKTFFYQNFRQIYYQVVYLIDGIMLMIAGMVGLVKGESINDFLASFMQIIKSPNNSNNKYLLKGLSARLFGMLLTIGGIIFLALAYLKIIPIYP